MLYMRMLCHEALRGQKITLSRDPEQPCGSGITKGDRVEVMDVQQNDAPFKGEHKYLVSNQATGMQAWCSQAALGAGDEVSSSAATTPAMPSYSQADA